MKTLIHTLSTGDPVWRNAENRTISIPFQGPRKVLSTSLVNGGYREDLKLVFNHNSCGEGDKGMVMKGNSYQEHMEITAVELGFDPQTAASMGTAVAMENAVIAVERFSDLTVTAIVTGGVEGNGGRVGDPTEHYLTVDKAKLHKPGTINIILVVDADLPPGMLARALVTCTEAKTAALQELLSGSICSTGLATGSGTDQTVVIANPLSPLYFESAGKHSKVGELIGKVVLRSVKEALYQHSGLGPEMQHSVFRRLQRYGLSMESMQGREKISDPSFPKTLTKLDKDSVLISYVSLYVHLLDQLQWNLLSPVEVHRTCSDLLKQISEHFHVRPFLPDQATMQGCLYALKQQIVEIAVSKLQFHH